MSFRSRFLTLQRRGQRSVPDGRPSQSSEENLRRPKEPAQDAIAYFEGVRKTMGARKADEFLRLFMVPGMGHCAGGAGTDIYGAARSIESPVPLELLKVDPEHDLLSAMEQWVEKGAAPQ